MLLIILFSILSASSLALVSIPHHSGSGRRSYQVDTGRLLLLAGDGSYADPSIPVSVFTEVEGASAASY